MRSARLRPPPSSSAGAVTPTGGGLPVVRFAVRRRRRGLREARFPPGVGGSRGQQRPRRGGAPPLAGGGGGGNDGVLPPARRWGAAAPLQDFRSSAAAPPDQARPNQRPSCRRRATRVFVCPRRRGWAMFTYLDGGLPVVGFGCRWPGRVRDGMAFPSRLGGSRRPLRLRRFSCSPVLRVDALSTVSVVRRGRRSLRWGRCSTTPEALYSWLWALVLGSRVFGCVSPLWRATAACELLRRTCPGELFGLSGADSGACQSRLGSVMHWRELSAS